MRWHIYFIVICFPVLTGLRASAQKDFEIIDRQKVEQLVNDASLSSFYPALMERFNAFDTSLKLSDYRLLYYGFVFQPAYSWNADQQKKEMTVAMLADQYDKVIRLADSILEKIPVSLTAHYFRAYAMLNSRGKDSSYEQYVRRYAGLRNAILSSGDGLRCNTAFKTIFIEDEYEILNNYFESDGHTTQSPEYSCDRFLVTPSGTYQHDEIFFDASEILLGIQKELKLGSFMHPAGIRDSIPAKAIPTNGY